MKHTNTHTQKGEGESEGRAGGWWLLTEQFHRSISGTSDEESIGGGGERPVPEG